MIPIWAAWVIAMACSILLGFVVRHDQKEVYTKALAEYQDLVREKVVEAEAALGKLEQKMLFQENIIGIYKLLLDGYEKDMAALEKK